MKKLYLVRHAKSSWKDMSLDDIDRPLNKRGKRDAPFMGQLMKEKNIVPDRLITSPAKRAKDTGIAFAKALGAKQDKFEIDPKVYEATVTDLISLIQNWNNEWSTVLLFGHNYTYTMFANYYANPPIDNVPTGAVVAIEFEVEEWKDVNLENGRVVFFEYPRKYFPKNK